MTKNLNLTKYSIGFIIGIIVIILLQLLTTYTTERNNSRMKLYTIVEDTYCITNTTLQDYSDGYINCCRIKYSDPPIQNYIINNITVNIIQCYEALAGIQ
jgi:hypothetical protein